MASSLGGPGMASGVQTPRRVNLEFPPPPPYPPPHNQVACGGMLDPIASLGSPMTTSHQHPLQDYSYACYEPGPSRLHSPYPAEVALNRIQQPQQLRSDPLKRHTYVTRYGTEENIYEEISEISRQCQLALHGSRRSLLAEEFRRVQSGHRRVLGELNLSVEAMLMPTASDNNEDEELSGSNKDGTSTEELLSSSATDDLLSPLGCDMDSGFSGSSSASYRSGLGSLRRGMGKTSTPEMNGTQRKTKAVMIFKKGWKGWKKLHSFGNDQQKIEDLVR